MTHRPPLDDQQPPASSAEAVHTVCCPETLRALLQAPPPDEETLRVWLFDAERGRGLEPEQIARLLNLTAAPAREAVRQAAHRLHERLFARRVRLLTPVCPSNRCDSECLYCPLRQSNSRLRRTVASPRDLQHEVVALLDEGYRHLTLVMGSRPEAVPYVRDMAEAALGVRSGPRWIERLDLNLDASAPAELQTLAALRCGTYHQYQETYDPERYAQLHVAGPKQDFAWRLTAHDRACAAGLRDVGLGVLLGAHDPRLDVLALLLHERHLVQTYGAATVISYPRLLAVPDTPASQDTTWAVSDEALTYIVAVTRLATPLVEIALITPAPSAVRCQLYGLGISQVSVGSLSYPGVYTADGAPQAAGRLTVGRPRNLERLIYRMCEVGVIPDLCVGTYAAGRQVSAQERLHDDGRLLHQATANALLALREYALDFASAETRDITDSTIQEGLARLPRKIRDMTLELMDEVDAGLRRLML